ncbi:MAG: HEPN domain-containing protein [Oscillospiraceae bacterium]|jgi:HEPN domain-containing protein|nr:HEPN domain-containing protein [Oscillospiraceae bacterium]
MDGLEKFEYWFDIAKYDLTVAESMLRDGHWLYVVFMCQQAVEKLVKGLYSFYLPDAPPHLHNIKAIVKKFEHCLPQAVPIDTIDFFDTLTAYYLNNRYPDYVSKLSSQISEQEASDTLRTTKEVFIWLLTLKP